MAVPNDKLFLVWKIRGGARSLAFRIKQFSFVEFVTVTADIKPAVLWTGGNRPAFFACFMATKNKNRFRSFSDIAH